MTKITIPVDRWHREQTQVIAGVEFVDGQADVDLGPSARSYFERFGFGIEETAVVAGESVALADMTRAQLLAEADARGIHISRRNATKPAILAELEAGLAAPAEVEYADGRAVEYDDRGTPILREAEPEIEPAALHVDGKSDDDLSAEALASAETV